MSNENAGLRDGDTVKFIVEEADFRKSKAGAEMFVLGLEVQNRDGALGTVREYIMADNAKRLGAFLRSVHMAADQRGEGVELKAASLIGKRGRGSIRLEAANGDWPARWRMARFGSNFDEVPRPERIRHGEVSEGPEWLKKWGLVTAHALKYALEVPAKDGAQIVAELESLTGWATIPTPAPAKPAAPAKPTARPADDNVPF